MYLHRATGLAKSELEAGMVRCPATCSGDGNEGEQSAGAGGEDRGGDVLLGVGTSKRGSISD